MCVYILTSRENILRERSRGLTFPATRPRAVLQALRVNVTRSHAGNGVRRKIRKDGGYRRLDDKRYQKQEGEDGEDRRGAHAEGRVKLGLLDHGADLGLLDLDAHYHCRFVGLNGGGFCGPRAGPTRVT